MMVFYFCETGTTYANLYISFLIYFVQNAPIADKYSCMFYVQCDPYTEKKCENGSEGVKTEEEKAVNANL